MNVWRITLIVMSVNQINTQRGLTPTLTEVDQLKNVGAFNDAQHRGPKWYNDDLTDSSSSSSSDMHSSVTGSSSSSISSGESTSRSSESSEVSSQETKERRRVTQMHRICVACPHDMLKRWKNVGIKWICAGYQRARRTFKSECMMRYRNCQDGTMFVKLYDHRCKNDTYHGKHWFYVYKV